MGISSSRPSVAVDDEEETHLGGRYCIPFASSPPPPSHSNDDDSNSSGSTEFHSIVDDSVPNDKFSVEQNADVMLMKEEAKEESATKQEKYDDDDDDDGGSKKDEECGTAANGQDSFLHLDVGGDQKEDEDDGTSDAPLPRIGLPPPSAALDDASINNDDDDAGMNEQEGGTTKIEADDEQVGSLKAEEDKRATNTDNSLDRTPEEEDSIQSPPPARSKRMASIDTGSNFFSAEAPLRTDKKNSEDGSKRKRFWYDDEDDDEKAEQNREVILVGVKGKHPAAAATLKDIPEKKGAAALDHDECFSNSASKKCKGRAVVAPSQEVARGEGRARKKTPSSNKKRRSIMQDRELGTPDRSPRSTFLAGRTQKFQSKITGPTAVVAKRPHRRVEKKSQAGSRCGGSGERNAKLSQKKGDMTPLGNHQQWAVESKKKRPGMVGHGTTTKSDETRQDRKRRTSTSQRIIFIDSDSDDDDDEDEDDVESKQIPEKLKKEVYDYPVAADRKTSPCPSDNRPRKKPKKKQTYLLDSYPEMVSVAKSIGHPLIIPPHLR